MSDCPFGSSIRILNCHHNRTWPKNKSLDSPPPTKLLQNFSTHFSKQCHHHFVIQKQKLRIFPGSAFCKTSIPRPSHVSSASKIFYEAKLLCLTLLKLYCKVNIISCLDYCDSLLSGLSNPRLALPPNVANLTIPAKQQQECLFVFVFQIVTVLTPSPA